MTTPFRKKIEIIFSNKRKIQLDLPMIIPNSGVPASHCFQFHWHSLPTTQSQVSSQILVVICGGLR